MINKNDIVKYHDKLFKVDNIKGNRLKIHSIRGKDSEIIYGVPIDWVTKIEKEK